jgi:alkylation response protein AidB-like acyl-CoA dehydrogenase
VSGQLAEPEAPLEELLGKVCAELQEHIPRLSVTGDFPLGVADLLSRSGLTAVCLPRRFGGRGGGLLDLVTAVERVAGVDGATAWCLFILGTAPWLLCRAAPALVSEVYGDGDSRIAGALAPTGTLKSNGGGYIVTGRWTFGSAVNACDWVAVHAVFADEPAPRSAFALVPASAVAYRETWDGLGLAASGSGAFAVTDLFVPAHRLIPDISAAPAWPDQAFRLPFRATFAACAAVLLGIATDALMAFTEYAKQKRPTYGTGVLSQQAHVRALVAEGWGSLHAARALLYLAVGNLEQASESGEPGVRLQAELRIAMNVVRSSCLALVDKLHFAAGGAASVATSRFARLLRDVHTASQHHMFSDGVTELAGSVLFGEDVTAGQL